MEGRKPDSFVAVSQHRSLKKKKNKDVGWEAEKLSSETTKRGRKSAENLTPEKPSFEEGTGHGRCSRHRPGALGGSTNGPLGERDPSRWAVNAVTAG